MEEERYETLVASRDKDRDRQTDTDREIDRLTVLLEVLLGDVWRKDVLVARETKIETDKQTQTER